MSAKTRTARIGVDVGGTFTDLVLHDPARDLVHAGKLLTTPDDPSVAIVAGLSRILRETELKPSDLHSLVHGTTLITNTIIERTGATVGLLTTEGFRDTMRSAARHATISMICFWKCRRPLFRVAAAWRFRSELTPTVRSCFVWMKTRWRPPRDSWLSVTIARHWLSRSCTHIALPNTSEERGRSCDACTVAAAVAFGGSGSGNSRIREDEHGLRQRLCAAADAAVSRQA